MSKCLASLAIAWTGQAGSPSYSPRLSAGKLVQGRRVMIPYRFS